MDNFQTVPSRLVLTHQMTVFLAMQEAEVYGRGLVSSAWCPNIVRALLQLMSIRRYRVNLEDVAAVICSNLAPRGPFSGKRVSLVLS